MFTLQFPRSEISYWAGRYPIETDYEVENIIAPQVQKRGYFTKPEFVVLCRWKTPRSKPLVASNQEESVKEITRLALSTTDERQRMELLTLLSGVGWPTASVLLHFGHSDLYPIHDFRALWSLGVEDSEKLKKFSFWQAYTSFCRQLAAEAGMTMRILDRALWQYSKENQK